MAEANGTILACVDFSDVTDAVVGETEVLAKALGWGVCLLHVCMDEPEFVSYEPGPEYIRMDFAEQCRDAHRKLQGIEGDLKGRGLAAEALVVQGNSVLKIVEKAEHLKAGLIVMGSHGHGAARVVSVG